MILGYLFSTHAWVLTFTSRTCFGIWLLPGAQVYKQKTNKVNKNIISLVGGGGAEAAGAQPSLKQGCVG